LVDTAGVTDGPTSRDAQGAVFLSYASEDAPAAERICSALRAAGIEVWFDRSELRGGDAWDGAIRRQIRQCALFIPIISANAHARAEGYFRLEWKLATDRSHLIAPDKPFLVPVAVDGTPQSDERIPDRFRELQWTRLPAGETPPAFVERVRGLLGAGALAAPSRAGSGAGEAAHWQRPAAARGRPLRTLIWACALVIVVPVLGYYGFMLSQRHSHAAPSSGTVAPPGGTDPIPEKSIAVLPLLDMSEKKDQEYFSDGLTEELLDLLAQVPDLRVPARTSSFYFKGRTDDVATIAQKLRVAHVLEGSVRRSGNHIRVTAQLIRADNGYHMWSKTYDRDLKDVFQVQDEIANAVVTALKAQLLSGQPLTNRHRTDNTEAFNEYLIGRKLRERDTPDSNRQALESFQRAAALDPNYAAAYSGISDAEWRIADQSTAEPAGYQRSLAAAERAIQLAPDLPEGYQARGNLRMDYYYDWKGAEADFQKALELDASEVQVLRDYALLQAGRGRTAQAIELFHRMLAVDPLSTQGGRQLVLLLLDEGQVAEAKKITQRYLETMPTPWSGPELAAEVAMAEGRFADALADYQRARHATALIGSAMAQYSLGRTAESQAALDELTGRYSATLAYQIAQVHAWRGERDQALDWLERAYRQRDGGLIHVTHDRYFAGLRDTARFRALLQKLNLLT
jgi:adenylate cyclase